MATSATHFGLALCDELVAEGLERGIVAARDERAQVQGSPDAGAAAADEALAAPASGLARPGREPGEGGDGAPVEGARARAARR